MESMRSYLEKLQKTKPFVESNKYIEKAKEDQAAYEAEEETWQHDTVPLRLIVEVDFGESLHKRTSSCASPSILTNTRTKSRECTS